MIGPRTTPRRIRFLGIILLAIGLPACHGGGPLSPHLGDGSGRVAYRPVPTSLRGRPFYVSGYGGNDYSPARPRRMAPNGDSPAYVAPMPAPNPRSVTVSQGTWDEP
jgi:hypothetical protein